MKQASKFLAACILAVAPMTNVANAASSSDANFPSAAVSKINSQGFRICRAMGNSGYTAVARGILGDGGGGLRSAGFRQFQVRTCFETAAACERFIDRIDHRISQIEQLYYAGCKPRA